MIVSLKERYKNEVVKSLMSDLAIKNVMQVPKIEKVVLNMGLGSSMNDSKSFDIAVSELTSISGRKPVITRAKKAISNFKIKAGNPIGCMVTLRKNIMYEFLDRLINIALPRVRDFRGISPKAFDGFGNYTLGIVEHLIFPEIDYDKIDKIKGLNITIVTTAKDNKGGYMLLKKLGFPFRK